MFGQLLSDAATHLIKVMSAPLSQAAISLLDQGEMFTVWKKKSHLKLARF